MSGVLHAAATDSPVEVDAEARTISGLLVPYGKTGATSAGRVTFAHGDITWHQDTSRIKLLLEHDQRQPVGYATQLESRPDGEAPGLYGTFHVPESDDGDRVLAQARSKVRDGFSVGVQLDDATQARLRKSRGESVRGVGVLRETSSVSVPAFDDSRVSAVASSSDLVVSAWADEHTTTRKDHPMSDQPAAQADQQLEAGLADQLRAFLEANAPKTAEAGTTAPQATTPTVAPAPAPLATAGAATVTDEAPVYTFSGEGPSICRDTVLAKFSNDTEAAERLARFNRQLTDGNPSSVLAVAAVAKTTDDAALDPGHYVLRTQYRPDLMRTAIDRGRPIISRLDTINITSATPFAVPTEGEFSGVGDHVEGTAHVPEGTLTMGDGMVQPRACSGAYRLSRELLDAYNPALDRIALRAMIRDYRRVSEGKAAALFNALVSDDATAPTDGQGSSIYLRQQLMAFAPDDADEMPDFVLAGRSFVTALGGDVDGNGRPILGVSASAGGIGTLVAGYTGLAIDGVPVGRASRLTPDTAVMAEKDAILWAESRVQTFRYDEVEGPGVVKLALWAYVGGAIIDRAGVRKLELA